MLSSLSLTLASKKGGPICACKGCKLRFQPGDLRVTTKDAAKPASHRRLECISPTLMCASPPRPARAPYR